MGGFFVGDDMIDLRQGDCLEVMKSIPDGSVDLILTDPPYQITSCEWDFIIPLDAMWSELKRIIKPNGAIALFGAEPFSSELRLSNKKQYKYDWIYQKSVATNFLNAKKQPLRNHEIVSIFYSKQCAYNPQMTEGKPYKCVSGSTNAKSVTADVNITKGGHLTVNKGERYPLSITEKINPEKGLHPTQKPVALMEYLIKTYTNESDTILDFTMGSGSTGVAAINTNRRFIGIELDPDYFKIAEDRINQAAENSGFLMPT